MGPSDDLIPSPTPSSEEQLVEAITRLFLRLDGAPAQEGVDEAHRARLRFEWTLGQWVMAPPDPHQFWGWMSWYRVSPEIFEALKREDLRAVIAAGSPDLTLTQGPCLYIATAVVAPRAPRETYRRLYAAVRAANPDARVAGAWMRKRNGRMFWHERLLRQDDPAPHNMTH
jgi:hypothetical protein